MLDRAVYGAISKPHALRVVATLVNWSLLIYFVSRSGLTFKTAAVIAVYTIITLCFWRAMPAAVGISAVWCALYATLPLHTAADHAIFWVHNLMVLLVPALTREWGPQFYMLANAAHASSAASAYLLFHSFT